MCFAGELFLFCFIGNLVLDECEHLQQTAYNCQWYDYSMNETKLIQLMILRAQKPIGLNAFNYFHCDNKTFSAVKKMVYIISLQLY